MEAPASPERHFGELVRKAREAKGLSQETLARELNILPGLVTALESGNWALLPTGQERPLARQLAMRLGLDPSLHPEAWSELPGEGTEEVSNPGQDRLERAVMLILAVGTVGLVAWLILPGPSLRRQSPTTLSPAPLPSPTAPKVALPAQPFPVLGEAIPEAPFTEEGVLVILRTADRCEARVVGQGLDVKRTLQVSEPWTLRVKGAFTLTLENAGVVTVHVAGKVIRHAQSVGEAWQGSFDDRGEWLRPSPPEEPPATSPETEPESGDT